MKIGVILFVFVITDTACSRQISPEEHKCPEKFVLVAAKESIFSEEENVHLPDPNCYHVVLERASFQEALDVCEAMNSTLATPRTREVSAGLVNYIIGSDIRERRFWIGLTDRVTEGFLTWIDDEPLNEEEFSPWLLSEPHSQTSAAPGSKATIDDCVKLALRLRGTTYSAQWFDTDCSRREAYICETDSIPHITATSKVTATESTTNYNQLPTEDLGKLIKIHWTSTDMNVANEETYQPLTGISTKSQSTIVPISVSPTKVTKRPIKVVAYGEDASRTTNSSVTTPTDERNRSGKKTCKLDCTPNVMIAACPLHLFPLINDTRAVLNNLSCATRRNGTHLIVHTTLDGCGTVARNLRGGQVSFQNTIRFISQGSSVVRDASDIDSLTDFMILDCRYPQRHQLQQNFRPAESRPQVHFSVSNGPSLPHAFMLYKSNTFECPYGKQDFPVRISISNRLYFEVRLRIASQQVEIHPVTCKATPDTNFLNPRSYTMLQDGCIEDSTFRMEESNSSKISRFSVQAFRFVGIFSRVYIQCELIVCKIGSESSTSCPYACESGKERKRRDSASNIEVIDLDDVSLIHAKLGPITIALDETDASGSRDLQTDSPAQEKTFSNENNPKRVEKHTAKPLALRDKEGKPKVSTTPSVAGAGGRGVACQFSSNILPFITSILVMIVA